MLLLHASSVGRMAPGVRLATLSTATRLFRASSIAPGSFATRWPIVLSRHYSGQKLDLPSIDRKWRDKLVAAGTKASGEANGSKEKRYILPMFPYPSGNLHLGHLRVYTIADVVARFRALQGHKVVLPMGWDAFGLPAENAAIERGIDPATWTRNNIEKMKEQLTLMNGSWNWDRELTTSEPDFYKHTQKLFLMLFERGLAYQAKAEVNYDPVDKTVLANEQVDANGHSWRSGAKVEKLQLKQWFFRISAFREALLQDLDILAKDDAWPERVLAMQKNWLGKSNGAKIKFPVMAMGHDIHAAIEVFTTRPDTLFGVQYIALAATHPVVAQLAEKDPELQAFLDTLPGLPPDSKIGYLLPHLRAVNPLAYHDDTPDATKISLPVYVAPYVLGDYGEGAVMGVPGHDLRDHAFWKEHHYDEPIRVVLAASEDESTTVMLNEPLVEPGIMTEHGGPFKGLHSAEAGQLLVAMLKAANMAEPMEKWRLRDWLISRQRYWGTPIPIIHCGTCGTVPVPDDQLPVKLPEVDAHWAAGKAGNPLESAHDWVNTKCPKCGGDAKRDTDTMDTFVDSSWYYTRFTDPQNPALPFSHEAASSLLPVDLYIGGIEHAILHLLYARFIYKFLQTTELFPEPIQSPRSVGEPFTRLITQGMVHGKTYSDPSTGRFLKPDEVDLSDASNPKVASTSEAARVSFEKMSKSKHNGVDPTEFIAKYGADATRAHMIFQAPVSDVLNWDETKILGVTRWLGRLHDLVHDLGRDPASPTVTAKTYIEDCVEGVASMSQEQLSQWDADASIWREVQRTIESVTAAYEKVYSLNTVVSDLMALTNTILDNGSANPVIRRDAVTSLLTMLAPIAPAFAEECWSVLQPTAAAAATGPALLASSAAFPVPDGTAAILQPRMQRVAVQVNGKLRGVVEMPQAPVKLAGDALRAWMVEKLLLTEDGRTKFSSGPYDVRSAKKTIIAPGGKTMNFVI